MVIVMPPGYGIVDKTGWLSDTIVTDPVLVAKAHASMMASIAREHPGETIIDLSAAGQVAADGKMPEKPEPEAPLTYSVTGSKGNSSEGSGLSSFESVIELLMSNSGNNATVKLTGLGKHTFEELMDRINELSRPD